MKTKIKTKKKRSTEEASSGGNAARIKALREQWGEKDSKGSGSKGDDSYVELKEGTNKLRILPNRDPDEIWFEDYYVHWNMGPDSEDSFLCIEPGGAFGHSPKNDKKRNYRAKLCPACKKYCKHKSKSRAFEFGSKKGKQYWSDHVAPWRAKHQFVCGTAAPKKSKVKILRCGEMIAKPLVEAFFDEDGGGDFTHPKTGRMVIIKKKKLSSRATDISYTTAISPNREKLLHWEKIKEHLPDLKSFVPERLEPDAILAIMNGDGRDDDDDDDDDAPRSKKRKKGATRRDDDDADTDDDDDEEEGGKRTFGRRKRGEDEEVDADAEEEDDDEDAAPKKKSKLRDKLAKKARKTKDDDDEESDDDDEAEEDDDEDLDDDEEEGDEDEDEDDDEGEDED